LVQIAEGGLISKLEAGHNQKVVCMGTSLTAGDRWVAPLRDWLISRYPSQVEMINSGVPGSESSDGIRDLQVLVLNHQPDVLFIEYGMNDAWSIGEGYPEKISPETSTANLNFIIDSLLLQNPNADVILQTTNASTSIHRPRLPLYYQVHRDVATARGLMLIDQYPVWEKILIEEPELYAQYVSDGVHPSAIAWGAIGFPIIQCSLLSTQFIRGDIDTDGFINDDDLSILLSNWNTGEQWEHGNCDGAGVVGDDDLSYLLANWTGPPPTAIIPIRLPY